MLHLSWAVIHLGKRKNNKNSLRKYCETKPGMFVTLIPLGSQVFNVLCPHNFLFLTTNNNNDKENCFISFG